MGDNYMFGNVFDTGKIEVEATELASLKEDSRFLRALEAAGVDSWEGYRLAIEIYDTFNK